MAKQAINAAISTASDTIEIGLRGALSPDPTDGRAAHFAVRIEPIRRLVNKCRRLAQGGQTSPLRPTATASTRKPCASSWPAVVDASDERCLRSMTAVASKSFEVEWRKFTQVRQIGGDGLLGNFPGQMLAEIETDQTRLRA